jgi:hypothetical protein
MIVVVPIALYHGIERPAIRLGTKLADKMSSNPDLQAAQATG